MLANFKEAKEIQDLYNDTEKFNQLLSEKQNAEVDIYKQFAKILNAINNIQFTLRNDNKKFWGEK